MREEGKSPSVLSLVRSELVGEVRGRERETERKERDLGKENNKASMKELRLRRGRDGRGRRSGKMPPPEEAKASQYVMKG